MRSGVSEVYINVHEHTPPRTDGHPNQKIKENGSDAGNHGWRSVQEVHEPPVLAADGPLYLIFSVRGAKNQTNTTPVAATVQTESRCGLIHGFACDALPLTQ